MICIIKIYLSCKKMPKKLWLFIVAKLFYAKPQHEKEEISIINRNMGRLKNKWSVLSWSQQPDHLTFLLMYLSKVYFVCKKGRQVKLSKSDSFYFTAAVIVVGWFLLLLMMMTMMSVCTDPFPVLHAIQNVTLKMYPRRSKNYYCRQQTVAYKTVRCDFDFTVISFSPFVRNENINTAWMMMIQRKVRVQNPATYLHTERI